MTVKKKTSMNTIIMHSILIIGLVMFSLPPLPPLSFAAENVYYVAKNGSDSNPGTEAEPWLTIQHAADTLQPGDTVYIKAGVYDEMVTPENSGYANIPITYKANQGDKVIVNASGVLANWTHYSGNVYKTTIDWAAVPHSVWENGDSDNTIRLTNASDIPTGPGQFYYDTAIKTVYVWTSDGANPNNKTMIGDNRFAAFNCRFKEYLVIDGFEVAYGSVNISIVQSSHIELKNNIFRDPGQSSNINALAASFAHIHHNTVLRGANCGIFLSVGAHNNLIEYNEVKDVWNEDAIGLSTQPVPMGNDNVIQYNELSGSEEDGIDVYSGSRQIIRNNNIHDNGEMGIIVHGGDHCVIENNTVQLNGREGLFLSDEDGSGEHNEIRNNLFYNNGIRLSGSSGVTIKASNSKLYNNTIIGPETASRELVTIYTGYHSSTDNVEFNNNIMVNPKRIFHTDEDGIDFTADNNLYFQTGTFSFASLGSVIYNDFSSFRSASGKDANSNYADPRFVDAQNNNYHLQPSSPAIDTATSDSAPVTDLDGNLRYDDPLVSNMGRGQYSFFDIGAYEYQGTGSHPTGYITISQGTDYSSSRSVVIANSISGATEMRFSLDGGSTWSNWDLYVSTKSLILPYGDGTKTVQAEFRDAAQNTYSTSDTIILDTTPPNTKIVSGPSGTIDITNATFTWTDSSDLFNPSPVEFSYRLLGYNGIWSNWSSDTTYTFTGLPAGQYIFQVRSRDPAGNIDPTPASISFSVAYSNKTWYLAEGFTGGDFDTWVLIQNPNAQEANVTATFMKNDGSTVERTYTLAPTSRKTIKVDEILPNDEVSTKVTSDQPVIAERAMYFNYNGKEGGHDSIGTASPSNTWYLAEGFTGGDFDTWVLIQNPNNETANVTATFMKNDGSTVERTYTLAPTSRKTIKVDEILPNDEVSTKVTSDQPVIAERALYFNYNGKDGGHSSIGTTSASDTWYLAEGFTGGDFDTWVLIQNPNTEEANITTTFMKNDGSTVERTYTLAPTSRKTIKVDDILPNDEVSTKVVSDQPVIAERALYFNYNGKDGGHSSIGTTSASDTWYLAEGFTGGDFDTWVLIQNPNAQEANVTATFMKNDGSTVERTYTLAPTSRKTIMVDEILPNDEVSTKITSDQPVIAERAMYFSYNGKSGGHSSIGYAY